MSKQDLQSALEIQVHRVIHAKSLRWADLQSKKLTVTRSHAVWSEPRFQSLRGRNQAQLTLLSAVLPGPSPVQEQDIGAIFAKLT